MISKSIKCLLAIPFLTTPIYSDSNNEWFSDAAISPNGKTIAFSYKGDIYAVSAKGGIARPLTINAAWEGKPVWSPNGKRLAFASDRHGNLDIFSMPSWGGKAIRLTHHSSNDIPSDYAPDGSSILFSSSRMDAKDSSLFPTGALAELYQIPSSGGNPTMVLTTPASEATWDSSGSRILYRDEKSYEQVRRKHDDSSFARDIWLYDSKDGSHKQITSFKKGDHNPVWKNGSEAYYVSEDTSDIFNVWKINLDNGNKKQISSFTQHPVRSLTASDKGLLAYTHHGSIYTQKDGGKAKAVKVTIASDSHGVDIANIPVNGSITDFAVSPNEKEIAFIVRGEVFVTSKDFSTTKRITNTPEQERSLSFAPDGRSLVYASERGGRWKIMETSLSDEAEKYFFASTKIEEKISYQGDDEAFQPKVSPDGKSIAFISQRDALKVVSRESGEAKLVLGGEHFYSYSDGDRSFSWSPDSLWLINHMSGKGQSFVASNIAAVKADGSGDVRYVSLSGYREFAPMWHKESQAIIYYSLRYGERSHGSWGAEGDVVATFLTQDAWDKFNLSKEEYELENELKKDADKKKAADKKKETAKDEENDSEGQVNDADDDKKDEKIDPVNIEWDGLRDRTKRLTVHSSDLSDMALAKDGSKLYYLAKFEKGYDLWVQDFRERKTSLAVKLGAESASMEMGAKGETLYILAKGSLKKVDIKGKPAAKPIKISAMMALNADAERAYMFEHLWRQVDDKFYNPNMHGVDWKALKEAYQPKLVSIGNTRDFVALTSEMLGELNASHNWSRYISKPKNADSTASLGIITGAVSDEGVVIEDILDKGPLVKAKTGVIVGMKIVAIDGVKLKSNNNHAALLNNKSGKRVRLTIKPQEGEVFDAIVKPISRREESNLLYERWVKNRRSLVENLSGGRLGYVHIRGMNDASFRDIYSDIFGQNASKEALVVDTRFNGGGWLHNDLAILLSGKAYDKIKVRGRTTPGDPFDQWAKPSIVVVGEGNYSDAYGFPYAYRTLDIGKLVGMQVPGTMTAVWWETLQSGDFNFGIPQVGISDMNDNYLENQHIDPDYIVKNDPKSSAEGQDKQIEKAVTVLLEQLDAKE